MVSGSNCTVVAEAGLSSCVLSELFRSGPDAPFGCYPFFSPYYTWPAFVRRYFVCLPVAWDADMAAFPGCGCRGLPCLRDYKSDTKALQGNGVKQVRNVLWTLKDVIPQQLLGLGTSRLVPSRSGGRPEGLSGLEL